MMLEDSIIIFALLGLLGIFFLIQFRMMFFPHYRGEIIEFEPIFDKSCKSCRGKRKGKASLPIKVKTDDGEVISAEISYCTICMEKVGLGSRIGVTKVGSRNIAQACLNIKGRNA